MQLIYILLNYCGIYAIMFDTCAEFHNLIEIIIKLISYPFWNNMKNWSFSLPNSISLESFPF